MKITPLNELTAQQQSFISLIPDHVINKLKKLSYEEQMECVYIRESERRSKSPLIESLASFSPDFAHYTQIADCHSEKDYYQSYNEVMVFEGMIIGIKADDGRIISFMTPDTHIVTEEVMIWDSHYHDLYPETVTRTIHSELVLYLLHTKMR